MREIEYWAWMMTALVPEDKPGGRPR